MICSQLRYSLEDHLFYIGYQQGPPIVENQHQALYTMSHQAMQQQQHQQPQPQPQQPTQVIYLQYQTQAPQSKIIFFNKGFVFFLQRDGQVSKTKLTTNINGFHLVSITIKKCSIKLFVNMSRMQIDRSRHWFLGSFVFLVEKQQAWQKGNSS